MDLLNKIPPYLMDQELKKALSKYPHYDSNLPLSKAERLVKLLDVYDLFIPTQLSIDIYNQIYFALTRSFGRKAHLFNQLQMSQNRKIINSKNYYGRGINSIDSSLIVGTAGIGKSNALSRAVEIITNNNIIETEQPYTSIIPILIIDAQPSASVKGLFFDILRKIDMIIGTNYYDANNRSTVNTDSLLGAVANALLLHCGVLILDEISLAVSNKHSNSYINYINELINLCGISIIFVGTPNAIDFFSQTDYLSRRAMGCVYYNLDYDEYCKFCNILYTYQYTIKKVDINSEFTRKLYQLTNANLALTINLWYEAQKQAIINDKPQIDIDIITKAFNEKMSIMTPYISIEKRVLPHPIIDNSISIPKNNVIINEDNIFSTLSQKSNKNTDKAIDFLGQSISIEVISI